MKQELVGIATPKFIPSYPYCYIKKKKKNRKTPLQKAQQPSLVNFMNGLTLKCHHKCPLQHREQLENSSTTIFGHDINNANQMSLSSKSIEMKY